MKWFASSVFWKASIVCSPSFAWNGHADREGLQLRVKDLDFDHGTIIVRVGKEGSGLMLPSESLDPVARAAVACTGMVVPRAAAALIRRPEREVSARGHSWPWFWVLRSTRIR